MGHSSFGNCSVSLKSTHPVSFSLTKSRWGGVNMSRGSLWKPNECLDSWGDHWQWPCHHQYTVWSWTLCCHHEFHGQGSARARMHHSLASQEFCDYWPCMPPSCPTCSSTPLVPNSPYHCPIIPPPWPSDVISPGNRLIYSFSATGCVLYMPPPCHLLPFWVEQWLVTSGPFM